MNEKSGTRASIVLVAVGPVFYLIGFFVSMIEAQNNRYLQEAGAGGSSSFGTVLTVIGVGLFVLGLVIEFFSMGNSLRLIARSCQVHAAVQTIPAVQATAPGSESGILNPESPSSLTRLKLG